MNGGGYGNTASMPSMSPEPYNMPQSYTPGGNLDPNLQETAPYPTTPAPYIPSPQLPTVLQPASLPYIPDTQLPVILQPPVSLPYIPDSGLDPSLQMAPYPALSGSTAGLPSTPFFQDITAEQWLVPQKPPGDGPIEWLIETGKGALDLIWDTGKFILEHLDVGISYAGDIGSQRTQQRYYEDLADAQKTAADAARIKAQAYADAVKAGTMTQAEANARMAADKSPVFLTTPQATAAGPNYLLYGAIAVAAYYFLR